MLRGLACARRDPRGRELCLVWAGRPHPRRGAAIASLAGELGLRDAFVALGHVEDRALAALYRSAVCLLFVSRLEGFGYPLVEAMASGCPVVTSGGSSLGEVAGDAALIVDPDTPESVAEAVITLLDDGAERERWRERALRRAPRFDREHMARQTIDVYRHVIER
jgi:glycosyltransferase involved in cell wall biosynthesis